MVRFVLKLDPKSHVGSEEFKYLVWWPVSRSVDQVMLNHSFVSDQEHHLKSIFLLFHLSITIVDGIFPSVFRYTSPYQEVERSTEVERTDS